MQHQDICDTFISQKTIIMMLLYGASVARLSFRMEALSSMKASVRDAHVAQSKQVLVIATKFWTAVLSIPSVLRSSG